MKALLWASWALVVVCVVAWPLTSLTVFRDEPQGVLALSWIAIIYSAVTFAMTLKIKDDVDN